MLNMTHASTEGESFQDYLSYWRTENMNNVTGHKHWVIADGYIRPARIADCRQLVSHDAICILNRGDHDAHIGVTFVLVDHGPAGPYNITVKTLRTQHVRFNEVTDSGSVPRDTDYASIIVSDVPAVVQRTRLDSRQLALALMSTIAYPGELPDEPKRISAHFTCNLTSRAAALHRQRSRTGGPAGRLARPPAT